MSGVVEILPKVFGENLSRRHHGLAQALRTNSVIRFVQIGLGCSSGLVLPFFEKLPPCLAGLAACASAHYWAREIAAFGHEVRMMPARYVKAYVKHNKTGAGDAAAIREAVTRPTVRFVAIKSPEQQAVLMEHRTRQLLVRQRTALCGASRRPARLTAPAKPLNSLCFY